MYALLRLCHQEMSCLSKSLLPMMCSAVLTTLWRAEELLDHAQTHPVRTQEVEPQADRPYDWLGMVRSSVMWTTKEWESFESHSGVIRLEIIGFDSEMNHLKIIHIHVNKNTNNKPLLLSHK